jgi:oxygen-independent coproporphyrinogen-3 oxidase
VERYLSTIEEEFRLLNITRPFFTIYVGGGTPGALGANAMDRLCATLTANNGSLKPAEFSVEFSPCTVKREKIEILKRHGCGRITIGVQSFSDRIINLLGRRQTAAQAIAAYETIASCGIGNIGIDLIFGVPTQTLDEWLSDLRCAVSLHPHHISTYNLTFEDGTPLQRHALSGVTQKKSPDEEADFYAATWEFLGENGYGQYEISNFCLPGCESIHNTNTWKMHDWIGIGPSACSQFENRRFSNPPSIGLWSETIKRGALAYIGVENMDAKTLAEDSIIFGLRMNSGIDMASIECEFPSVDFSRLLQLMAYLEEENFTKWDGNSVRLTPRGRMVADAIALQVLEAM